MIARPGMLLDKLQANRAPPSAITDTTPPTRATVNNDASSDINPTFSGTSASIQTTGVRRQNAKKSTPTNELNMSTSAVVSPHYVSVTETTDH